MLQILLDHLLCHLPYRGTKVPSRPKMFSPISLLQMRKLFKQLARCAPRDPPHDLAWRHRRRTTGQNMHVILTHHAFAILISKASQVSRPTLELAPPRPPSALYTGTSLPTQSGTQFGKLYGYRIYTPCRTPLPQHIVAAKADRLKPVV